MYIYICICICICMCIYIYIHMYLTSEDDQLKKTLSIYIYLERVIKIVECQIVDHRQQGLPTLAGIPLPEQVKKVRVETRGQLHVYSIDLYILQIAISLKPEIHFKNQSFWVSIPLICGRYTYPKQILPKDLPFGVRCSYHPIEGPIRQALLPVFFFGKQKRVVGLQQPPKNTDFQKRNIPSFPPKKLGGGMWFIFFWRKSPRFFPRPNLGTVEKSPGR